MTNRPVMKPRPRWNRFGPKLPKWWLDDIKRIDPNLVMQFMLPRHVAEGLEPGCNRGLDERFPYGIWVVCRKLKRTSLLILESGWVYAIFDEDSNGYLVPRRPNKRDVHILRRAKNLWRSGQRHKMLNDLDAYFQSLRRDRFRKSREGLRARIAESLKNSGFSMRQNRISVPEFDAVA